MVTAENGSSALKLRLPVSFQLNCFVAGLLSCCSLTLRPIFPCGISERLSVQVDVGLIKMISSSQSLYFFFRDSLACVKNVGDSMTSSARECG